MQGSAPKKTSDEESSKFTTDAQGNGCYDAFVKKKKKNEENEAAVQLWQNPLHAHSDPLKAILKRDTNLISHLGSNKPIVTGSLS